MQAWNGRDTEFIHAARRVTSPFDHIEHKLLEVFSLQRVAGIDDTVMLQKSYLSQVMDCLVLAVDQQKPWLFVYDDIGRIERINHANRKPSEIVKFALRELDVFRIPDLVRQVDYEEGEALPGSTLRAVKLKSVAALMAAGTDLQNCLINPPLDGVPRNQFQLDYNQLILSGKTDFIAFCSSKGEMHALLRISDGVLQEAAGKQSCLLNSDYMPMLVDWVRRYNLDVVDDVFMTGLAKSRSGLVTYIDLVDPNRSEPITFDGHLNLGRLKHSYARHRITPHLVNIIVHGELCVDGSHFEMMRGVKAGSISAVDCFSLGDIHHDVVADQLITDSSPKNLRLHAAPSSGTYGIKEVVMTTSHDDRKQVQIIECVTAQEFVAMGNAPGANRPDAGPEDGSGGAPNP